MTDESLVEQSYRLIDELRQANDVSISELARLSGLPRSSVQNILHRKIRLKVEELDLMLRALGVEPELRAY